MLNYPDASRRQGGSNEDAGGLLWAPRLPSLQPTICGVLCSLGLIPAGYVVVSASQLPIRKGRRFASEAGLNSFVPSFELFASAAGGTDKRQDALDLTPLRPS